MENIKEFIKDSLDKYMFEGVIVGISGGIDSALVGKLLVDSIGKENVYGIILLERDTDSSTIDDAKLVCSFLDIEYKIIDITGILRKLGVYSLKPPAFPFPKSIQKRYSQNVWKKEEHPFIQDLTTQGDEKFLESLAYYRAKPRIRSTILYFEAEKRSYAVAGCTNKTEYAVGFYTKWGDEICDINPIFHLYKTEIFEMSRKLNIPEKIIDKKPSPDIAPGITDEFALGISYRELDKILIKIEKEEDLSLEDQDNVNKVKEMLKFSKFREVKQLHLL